MSGPARPDIPAAPLVMPQDEFEMVRWLFEMTGGPAFPANAATACRIAAKRNFGGLGEVFARLAEAVDGASAGAPQSPRRDAGDLQDWEGRARAAEAKLAALEALVAEGAPAVAVDRIEAILRNEEPAP